MKPFVGHGAELADLRAELTLVSTSPSATGWWPASRLGSHPLISPPRLAFGGKAGKPCVTRSPSFATV
jgi:hypothetical protein